MNDVEAKLMWDTSTDEGVKRNSVDVFVSDESVKRSEFYASYQSGVNSVCVFLINKYDFELSKHIEKDTNRPLYATSVMVEDAVYNIIRTFKKKDNEDIEMICT